MARWLLLLDPAAVVLFVAIGRDAHDGSPGLAGIGGTAAPFLIAVAAAWILTRAWRDPASSRTGAGVWAITVVAGMVLRRLAFGEGTAVAFVVVASVFLGVTMLGWRLVAGGRRGAAGV